MSRRYDSKRRPPAKQPCGVLRHIIMIFFAFIAGYGCASFYDYTRLIEWVNAHVLTKPPQPSPASQPTQDAHLPKPKFEFYTLLTKDARSGGETALSKGPSSASSQESATQTAPISIELNSSTQASKAPLDTQLSTTLSDATATSKDAYMVQLASFRTQQDAHRMRADLIMKGFIVAVMPVTQHNARWYRVVLGPFKNKPDAERAQRAISKSERIAGMVRKLDA